MKNALDTAVTNSVDKKMSRLGYNHHVHGLLHPWVVPDASMRFVLNCTIWRSYHPPTLIIAVFYATGETGA